MSRKPLVPVLVGTGILAAVALARGCGQAPGSPGVSVQEDAGVESIDATLEASGGHPETGGFGGSEPDANAGSGGQVADAGCPLQGLPAEVPQDWESYTGYSCDCPVYIPGEHGTPPAPIEWEACPVDGLQNVDCRIMKLEVGGTPFHMTSLYTYFSLDPSGTPLLEFLRYPQTTSAVQYMQVLAEADGPVRNAFMIVKSVSPYCDAMAEALSGDRYAIRLDGEHVGDAPDSVQGLIAGRVGEPHPDYVTKLYNGQAFPSDWDVSDQWILRKSSTYTVTGWDGLNPQLVYDPAQDPDGVPAHETQLVGGDIFFNVGSASYSATMSWTAADGLRPLLRAYGNVDNAYGNFGTDGHDMVWTYAQGYVSEFKYQKLSIMTAPYTTDPKVAQSTARRLRSDTFSFSPQPFRVGCGYAAREAVVGGGMGAIVVRLADGWSWFVVGKEGVPYPVHPLGLTCDELFVSTPTSIARVRLDSLGAGMPPD